MKKLSYLVFAMFALSTVFLTSCGDEETDPVGPTLNFVGASSADATVKAGQTITFKINAQKGDEDMKTLTLREEGNPLDTSRFTVAGEKQESSSVSLKSGDKNVFTKEITIVAPSKVGVTTVAIAVVDDKGESAGLQVTITVEAEVTSTPLATLTGTYRLFNKQGPSGYGGLKLADGTSVSSSAGDLADITSIGGTFTGAFKANASVTIVSAAANYSFAKADKETVAAAYNAGTTYSGASVPTVGSVFIAKSGDAYYVLEMKSKGEDKTVSALNGQYIEFTVKK